MKQRVLALAIKRIVWAELALTAVLAPPAFAQRQPAPGGGGRRGGGEHPPRPQKAYCCCCGAPW